MESRRVVLLTEGYLRGWLDFTHKTPTSALREEYLLSVLERHFVAQNSELRILALAPSIAAVPANGKVAMLSQQLQDHLELTLPYLGEKTKIRNSPNAAKLKDPGFWRKVLAERQAELDSAPPATDFVPVVPAMVQS